MNFKKIFAFALAGLMLVSVTACGKKAETASTKAKDSIVVAAMDEPETGFDPTVGWGHTTGTMFFSTLFTRDSDMKVVGDLATGYKLEDDKVTWTVTIKEGVKFSDGSDLTAQDVAYTYNTTKANPDSNEDLTMLESVTATDNNTVVFKVKSPQSTFLDKLLNIGIVSEKLHKADPVSYASAPVGSGPYILKQWDRGQQVICERNENYHGTQPYFKQVTLLFLDEDAKMSAVQSQKVDLAKVDYTYADVKVDGLNMQEVESVENIGICFPTSTPGQLTTTEGKTINHGHAVTSDIAIRKAFNIAFSREEMVNGILNGYGTPAYTGYEQMPWNNGSTIKDGDLEGAKKLLADAGWADSDNDGIIEKGGIKAEFDLIYTSATGTRQSFAVYISDSAQQLGIKINPVYKSWDEVETQGLLHNTPLVLSWGDHSAQLMYNLIHSDMRGIDFYNTGCYSNETVDKHMKDALESATDEEANSHWQKAIFDGTTGFGYEGDAVWAWYMNTNHIYFVREGLDLGKLQPQPHGGSILRSITQWTMK